MKRGDTSDDRVQVILRRLSSSWYGIELIHILRKRQMEDAGAQGLRCGQTVLLSRLIIISQTGVSRLKSATHKNLQPNHSCCSAPGDQHVGAQNKHIERFNNTLRQRVSRCHVGALVPCCRGKNDKKRVSGARLGMDRPLHFSCPPGLVLGELSAIAASLPESRPPSCARAGRQSPWPPWSSQTPFPSPQTASWW